MTLDTLQRFLTALSDIMPRNEFADSLLRMADALTGKKMTFEAKKMTFRDFAIANRGKQKDGKWKKRDLAQYLFPNANHRVALNQLNSLLRDTRCRPDTPLPTPKHPGNPVNPEYPGHPEPPENPEYPEYPEPPGSSENPEYPVPPKSPVPQGKPSRPATISLLDLLYLTGLRPRSHSLTTTQAALIFKWIKCL